MNSCANNQTVPCAGPEALIPCCQPTNYGEAAAFRFNLPDCRRGGGQNEYVVFVVPRVKDDRPSKPQPRRPCPTRCPPRPQCQDYDPPDGCVQRNYISVASASQPRACGRDLPAAHSKPSSCNFNRWSTEYRSTIDECARWVLDSDVRCKRRPIYPIQCLVDAPYHDQAMPDEEQCAESRPTCPVPPACYQRTCEPVTFKQEVVTPCPTRPPVEVSLPCPKPTVTTSTPSTSSRTARTNPTASSAPTSKQMTAPTTTRQISAVQTPSRRRRSPQQQDQQCEEDPHCCASPQHCPQMVGTRRPLPRCKPHSQACI